MDSSTTSNGNTFLSRFTGCYMDWIEQQKQDLDELNHALLTSANDDANLRVVIGRILDHFHDFLHRRLELVLIDAPTLLCKYWSSINLERSILWMGECRPTMSIRLVLAICRMETVASLLGGVRTGNLGELDYYQLNSINTLLLKTVEDEDALHSKMASFQERTWDEPLIRIVRNANRVGEWTEEVSKALDVYAANLGDLLKEADKLRMDTLKDLVEILTPFQAVDMLISSKKLQLSLHGDTNTTTNNTNTNNTNTNNTNTNNTTTNN
ncbi:protein DOG1-like 2 [Impatiens glandulifera]|uniref:protein DOG1-like 2 n=1 Tax=Impatiens glandulifera TaxID=253017 RepID=UPI001FB15EDA|nr:protein DOG1-like 2 [Impatiens glandulifera]